MVGITIICGVIVALFMPIWDLRLCALVCICGGFMAQNKVYRLRVDIPENTVVERRYGPSAADFASAVKDALSAIWTNVQVAFPDDKDAFRRACVAFWRSSRSASPDRFSLRIVKHTLHLATIILDRVIEEQLSMQL
jgi:hypothetical protein